MSNDGRMVNSDFPACDRSPSFECDARPIPEDHGAPGVLASDPSELLASCARLSRANYQVLARVNAVLQMAPFRPGF